ncbi:pyridoxal phosphate phosphatase [Scaptodrosophila lebanonensis]|uniref:Pyridoxal phosphate phosphatase n=1 Tax=Drosophila lebanonensis TaxID=7225 RepID=A0A6J2TDE4_DROLE|nr:pyridoxal phosphate phosphatase [Scaptodrosophila lebanonensis]
MFKQSCTNLKKLPKQRVRKWLGGIETIIFDADGVLWSFGEAIKGSVDTFNLIRSLGRNTFVATNNSEALTETLVKKALGFGYELKEQELISSSMSIANFLASRQFQKKVYVIGEQGVADELAKVGICSEFKIKDELTVPSKQFAAEMEIDEDVGAVVVAKDDNFSVAKIIRACNYLQNPKTLFLATCVDASYPIGVGNRIIVGAAAMLAAVQAICKRKPLILGKPNPLMAAELLQCGVIKPETTLMVGDTLHTDIAFGCNCGFHTMLVGTGVSSLKEAQALIEDDDDKKKNMIPDTYLPSVCDLQEFLC